MQRNLAHRSSCDDGDACGQHRTKKRTGAIRGVLQKSAVIEDGTCCPPAPALLHNAATPRAVTCWGGICFCRHLVPHVYIMYHRGVLGIINNIGLDLPEREREREPSSHAPSICSLATARGKRFWSAVGGGGFPLSQGVHRGREVHLGDAGTVLAQTLSVAEGQHGRQEGRATRASMAARGSTVAGDGPQCKTGKLFDHYEAGLFISYLTFFPRIHG